MKEIKDIKTILNHIEAYSTDYKNFSFIQIGACDGILYDEFNPLFLKTNWKGLLVEPRKTYFNKLKETYKKKDFNFENVAIANKKGTDYIYNFPEEKLFSSWQEGCATLTPDTHHELSNLNINDLSKEKVRCITWDNLIHKHHINDIHLLIIDTEGYDFEIIKQINFDTHHPHIIFYEYKHLGDNIKNSLNYVKDKGYIISMFKYNFLCFSTRFFNNS